MNIIFDFFAIYFIKNGIDIGEQPDGLGNDILINICEWTRTNSTS